MGHIPSGMEIRPAMDIERFDDIKMIVDEYSSIIWVVGDGSSPKSLMRMFGPDCNPTAENLLGVIGALQEETACT